MKLLLAIFLLSLFWSVTGSGQIRFEDIKIDTTITGFHFAGDLMGVRVYTPNGEADLSAEHPSAFSFTLIPDATFELALDQVNRLIEASKTNGYLISGMTKKDTTIQGNRVKLISYTETKKAEDYKNLVFNAVVMKGTTALIFLSGDLDRGKYADKFRNTFFAIKL
ncbi:MAG: hypothetical protein C5B59_10205 [Bacteroidetes bacterium]|nr:MAG: hypothetical protein C5B59_10205 [Bacteroidota bacterium]